MTDKITKLLSKLSKKDLHRIADTVDKIAKQEFDGLDIKTLKGQTGIYRVRIGSFRIIFIIDHQKKTNILSISRRNEKTYKDL
jgi:mRNA-degrading endonuclease RelE of RelBE toxin-antitoxin system